VHDLHLDLRKGEFLTLLGPSGSGKTTCLMMLAGFEPWTSGDIFLEGISLSGVPPHKRGMGVVFQNYALFPHMTVAQNVGFPLRQRGVAKAESRERVQRALAMVELAHLAERQPAQLSGGQQQRVALARALVFDPQLVLMDEPLGALDKRLREQMQIEIKHLHQQIGMIVLYVTHDQSEALTMSDRIAIFNRGRIEQIGTPEDIYERPITSFVANFVGENNNLRARVLEVCSGCCLLQLGECVPVKAMPAFPFEIGVEVCLSLRPELVKVGPDAASLANRAEVRLVEKTYSGDHMLLRCALVDGQTFIAKTSLSSARGLIVGKPIVIGWQPDDCRALPIID
jgi:putative spermidine/putrescine transport system ATP-binding protein